MKKILLVEDDETLAYLTADYLEMNGYVAIHCKDGITALETFQEDSPDLCILDIMIPAMNGFDLAQQIRQLNHEVPIIFLSAKSLKEDRIKGLRIGADDYLVKPFSMEELLLKIKIFLHRSKKASMSPTQMYTIGELQFDYENYILKVRDKTRTLTEKEASLLKLFLEHQNCVLKRSFILQHIWGEDDYFMGRSLDVFISRLRKMLREEVSCNIENLHGIGFRFSVKKQP